jgi:hypothetical protein
MTLMCDPIRELLQRNLKEIFGEGNAARRPTTRAWMW